MKNSFICLILCFSFSPVLWGQKLDENKEIVGSKAGEKNPLAKGLESGRYKAKGLPKKKESKQSTMTTVPLAQPVVVVSPREEPLSVSPANVPAKAPAPTDEPKVVPASAHLISDLVFSDSPSLVEQVKEIVEGKEPIQLRAYREQVHEDDNRLNRLEVELSSFLQYVDSDSDYSYRNYQSYSPGLEVGGRLWLTPFLGLHGHYGTTTSAGIRRNNNPGSVAVKFDSTDMGLMIRQYFGLSRRSNSVTFGLTYTESRLMVPSDELTRMGLVSKGFGVEVSGRIPVAPSFAWILGASLYPRLTAQEVETSLDLSSGSSPSTGRMKINLGSEIKFSRRHQILVGLEYQHETTQYDGSASQADPVTGQIPSGVTVQQGMTFLKFGYRWGQ
ncbi:MAG: hypothetical protein LW875_03520 [Proteobacteria bacterium]|jgi:hypothetical protein|nr:hypothetical protein [Pseudomonadota bacterium]